MDYRKLMYVLMLSLTLAVAGVSYAQSTQKSEHHEQGQATKAVTGKIAAIDTTKNTLEVSEQSGKSVKLMLNAETKVTRGGKEITLAELKSGDSVSVEYDDAGGNMVAKSVTVLSA